MRKIETNPRTRDAVELLMLRVYEINDLADNELREAVAAIKKHPDLFNRKDCKKYIRRAITAANEVQTAMRWRVPKDDHWNALCDFMDTRREQLKQSIDTMYYVHKQAIDKYKESHSDAKARCVNAFILLETAVLFPKQCVLKLGVFIRNITAVDRLMMGINYGGVYKLWKRVVDIVCVSDVEDRIVDIANAAYVEMSRDVLLNKITNVELFEEARKEAYNGR